MNAFVALILCADGSQHLYGTQAASFSDASTALLHHCHTEGLDVAGFSLHQIPADFKLLRQLPAPKRQKS